MEAPNFLNLGTKYASNEWEKNNLFILNVAFLIGCLSGGVYSILLFAGGNLFSALTILTGVLLCILGFYLNTVGRFSLALIAGCSVAGLVIPLHNWYFPNTGVVTYLLTITVIVSFLSSQNPGLRLFLIIFSASALLFCLLTIVFKHQGIQITESTKPSLLFNVISAFTGLTISTGYFSKLLQKQQIRFKNLNQVKNKLIAVLAHDLRGPLHNLVQVTELLNKGDLDKEEADILMGALSKDVKSSAELLDDVLIWIRSQLEGLQTNKVLFDLKDIVINVVEENKVKAELKGVALQVKGESSKIFADKDMIALAIRNLLTNAIKFSPPKNGEVIIDLNFEQGIPILSVIDNGKGLSKMEILKIKELKSFTNNGSNAEKGFGMGLFLTNEFLNQNEAQLDVTNAKKGGAQFSIKFKKQSF
ncbi:MAG: HAMP domain-containing histidine kinase [Bacteroidia bacterium]